MVQSTCKVCGGLYTEVFYEKNRVGKNSYLRRAICIGCRQSTRDEFKGRNRPLKKAQAVIKTHAPKLIARGKIGSESELATRYGWSVPEMVQDIINATKSACPYCLKPFSTMPHGLSDITLDIVDRDRPPYYKTNVRWVCTTCNRAKATTTADVWAERLAMWAEWGKRQAWLALQPKWQQEEMF